MHRIVSLFVFLAFSAICWPQSSRPADKLVPLPPGAKGDVPAIKPDGVPVIKIEMLPQNPPNMWSQLGPSLVSAFVAVIVVFLTSAVTRKAWESQTRLMVRKDNYVKLLNELGELRCRCARILSELQVAGGTYADGDQIDLEVRTLADAILLLDQSVGVSRLFMPTNALGALRNMAEGFRKAYCAFSAGKDGSRACSNLEASVRDLDNLRDRFLEIATRDLKITV